MSCASSTLRIADIIDGTSVDGPGLRTSIYVAGCAHRCPGCHNPSTWDFNSGREMSVPEVLDIVKRNGANVTLSGGDPFYQAAALAPLAQEIRALGLKIWCYTGFTFEELLGPEAQLGSRELLEAIDVLVDGPYIEALRDTKLMFRGSSNQRIIDVKASLHGASQATVVLHPSHGGPEIPEF